MAGKITGNAPLSNDFHWANTTTLRGWNKYNLDPLEEPAFSMSRWSGLPTASASSSITEQCGMPVKGQVLNFRLA